MREIAILLLIGCFVGSAFSAENPLKEITSLQKFRLELNQNQNFAGQQEVKQIENQAQAGYKSKGKALFRSLILPGAGERYLGKKNLAKAFLITEITLWIGYFSFREYGKWIKSDSRTFAADHSGASLSGKPSQYFVNLGLYDDVYQYNDAQQRMRNFDKVYSDPSFFWDWDSPENRRRYERMRIASDRAMNRSVLVLGGILANHLISAIDAVWQTHRYNKKLTKHSQHSINLDVKVDLNAGGFTLNFQKLF